MHQQRNYILIKNLRRCLCSKWAQKVNILMNENDVTIVLFLLPPVTMAFALTQYTKQLTPLGKDISRTGLESNFKQVRTRSWNGSDVKKVNDEQGVRAECF